MFYTHLKSCPDQHAEFCTAGVTWKPQIRESGQLSEDLYHEIPHLQGSICLYWKELTCYHLRIFWIWDFDVNIRYKTCKILKVDFCGLAYPLLCFLTFIAVTV